MQANFGKWLSGAARSVLAGFAMGASVAAMAQSGPYPNRPIKLIVPYSAGSGSDVIGRTIGQSVSEKIGQPMLIENRDGGGSLIGTMAAAKSPADGYTLLLVANPFLIGPSQNAKPQYDPIKDFEPVIKVAVMPLVLAANMQAPFTNIRELIAYAKANPGKLSYASSGPGTISQQEMELFKQAAGIDVVEIPFKSTAQAMTDTIGGQVALFPGVVPLTLPHIRAGKVRALAVFDTQRSAQLPDVPQTNEEVRVAGYTPSPVWYAFVAPAGTPKEVIAILSDVIKGAMQTTAVKERLSAMGVQPITRTNEQFVAEMKSEYEKAGQLAKKLGTYK